MCQPEGQTSLGKRILPYVATGLLAVIVVIFASSEGWLKRLVSEWFETCTLVIEVLDTESLDGSDSKVIPVNLYVQGKTPSVMNLSFKTKGNILEGVEFLRDASKDQLAMHPRSGEVCPKSSDLCTDMVPTGDAPPKQIITLELDNFDAVFDYSFRVTFSSAATAGDLEAFEVFVLYPENALGSNKPPLCRVEHADFTNLLVRSGPTMRFIYAALAVFALSVIVMVLNRWRKSD